MALELRLIVWNGGMKVQKTEAHKLEQTELEASILQKEEEISKKSLESLTLRKWFLCYLMFGMKPRLASLERLPLKTRRERL